MTKANEAGKAGKEKETPPESQALAKIDKTLADSVLARVKIFTANKDLRLPPDYSPENALKAAWLILLETKDANKQPVLEICTRESIANSLLKMVILGLNPLKKQCDFIAYGDKLSCNVSYFGDISLAKRHGGVSDIIPTVIYEGDVFEYEIKDGIKKVTKHVQKFENIDVNKIRGAYATVYFEEEGHESYTEIMTMTQVRQAWMQGAAKGNSPAHKNFPDQMAGKTAIARASKLFRNTSDDSDLEMGNGDPKLIESQKQIADNANKEEITMDIKAEVIDDKKDPPASENQNKPPDNTETKVPGAIPGF